jgi:hypothetical protein
MKKLLILVSVLVAFVVLGASSRVLAADPVRMDFGPFRITATQAARVAVANIGRKEDKGCLVKFIFFDSVGKPFNSYTVTIMPKNVHYDEMEGSTRVPPKQKDIEIWAVVIANVNKLQRCNVVATLEVRDNTTGNTISVLNNSTVIRDPGLIQDILNLIP